MNLKGLVEGVNILRPYYDNPDGYHVGAEHDEIYLYATDKPVSPEDVETLKNLGWHQEGTVNYDPEATWFGYV